MLPHSIDTALLRDLAAWATFVGVLGGGLLVRGVTLSRSGVVWLSGLWLLFWSLEYWLGGPGSFVYFNDEGELSLPLALYHFKWGDGGAFDWGIAGGMDFRAVLPSLGQHFGFERILFSLLPAWPALLAHKLAVGAVSMVGIYQLCRRGVQADRALSLALAALGSVGHAYLLQSTLNHGLGYALIPLAITVLAVGAGRPGYWRKVLGFGLLLSFSTSPLHSLPPLVLAVGMWCLAFNVRRVPLVAVAGVVVLLLVGVNWFSTVKMFLSYAALSPRGDAVLAPHSLSSFMLDLWDFFRRLGRGTYLGVLLALPLLLIRRDRWALTMAAVLVALILMGPVLNTIPWTSLGLDKIGAYEFNRIMFAIPPFACAALAACLPVLGRFKPQGRWPVAVALALAMLSLSVYKVQNFVSWFGFGGVGNLTAVPNLANRPWAPAEPFRVVTLPFKLLPDTPLAYGLETLDGYVMLLPRPIFTYWNQILLRPENPLRKKPSHNGLYMADPAGVDFRGMASVRLNDFVDVEKLRLGNVHFVISSMPLEDPDLTLVSGPEGGQHIARRDMSFTQKLKDDIGHILSPLPAYVYAVPNPLPRVFFARSLAGVDPDQLVAATARLAMDGDVVVDRAALAVLDQALDGAAKVVGYRRDPDRLTVSVQAPAGGVLVLNQQYLPFWSARIGTQDLPIAAANIIHMAVRVPPGTHDVVFEYTGRNGSSVPAMEHK